MLLYNEGGGYVLMAVWCSGTTWHNNVVWVKDNSGFPKICDHGKTLSSWNFRWRTSTSRKSGWEGDYEPAMSLLSRAILSFVISTMSTWSDICTKLVSVWAVATIERVDCTAISSLLQLEPYWLRRLDTSHSLCWKLSHSRLEQRLMELENWYLWNYALR